MAVSGDPVRAATHPPLAQAISSAAVLGEVTGRREGGGTPGTVEDGGERPVEDCLHEAGQEEEAGGGQVTEQVRECRVATKAA